ncbi:hypothetical protein GCM10023340_45510 [Nocardioides marinquilinus]|uniref:Nuclear transport factor 2 family protein n=1 Tax=Nocardioides marinquilinus TaxID=1210400 RepID=A0ABP9Q4I1_9ACTN
MRPPPVVRPVAAVAVVGVLALAAGCGTRPDTPEAAVRAYLAAYNAHDCDALDDLVAPGSGLGGGDGCDAFPHAVDQYMVDTVTVLDADGVQLDRTAEGGSDGDAVTVSLTFDQGRCYLGVVRRDGVWLLETQRCIGTRQSDGEPMTLDFE